MGSTQELLMWSATLFWVASFLVIYPYVIYPAFLAIAVRFRPEKDDSVKDEPFLPSVTVLISAFNEQSVIARKIENTLQLDYPAHLINILIVSDASDDDTDAIVNEWARKDDRIRLHRQANRHGKTAGINAAIESVTSDVVVFSDANAIYEADAIRQLTRYFVDENVGYVVGSALYRDDVEDAVKDSEGLYWTYELWIKRLESRFFSVVGGDGAIYAIRRELYWPLKETDINDFVNPLQIIARGYRGLFTSDARCYEYASDDFKKEFSRKRRIVNRSWRAVMTYAGQLNFRQHGWFIFMLISHKVIRWLSMPFILIAVVAAGIVLTTKFSAFYAVLLGLIVTSMALAVVGKWLDSLGKPMPRLVYLPYYFYFVGIASIMGIWDNLVGVKHVTWGHIRS